MDILCEEKIKEYLKTENKECFQIHCKSVTASTNDDVKVAAKNGEGEGYFLVSQRQEKGRGRMGRSFFSPENTGLYMSLLLKPNLANEQAVLVTTAAAVAVCRALEKVGCEPLELKWVNDVYKDDKKICGILTEGAFDPKGKLSYIVLGVGINLYEPQEGFPPELATIAGAAFKREAAEMKNRVAAEFLNEFYSFYQKIEKCPHSAEYRNRNFVIGKDVKLINGETERFGRVREMDDMCRICVEFADGTAEWISSGEVSLRLK